MSSNSTSVGVRPANVRATRERSFQLPLPVEQALPLFTPEGERRWAGDDWNPTYPIPTAVADDASPGTVFTTAADGGTAIWIVVQRRADGIRYARVIPDRIAGTIDVTCAPGASPGESTVTVVYDVTSLGPDGVAFVHELEADYDGFIDSWRREIVAALERE